MVIHDGILDRTTDARKKWKRRRIKVSQKTAAEIQTLDAGSWFDMKFAGAKVLRLEEALDFICGNDGVPLIEHKSGDAETLAHILRERRLINKVVVISFQLEISAGVARVGTSAGARSAGAAGAVEPWTAADSSAAPT